MEIGTLKNTNHTFNNPPASIKESEPIPKTNDRGHIKLQYEISKDRLAEIDLMAQYLNIKTRKELINNALTLMKWAIKEKRAGRIIASVDEKLKKYKELSMPIFDHLEE